MPELPEVETVRRDLQHLVVGRKIVSVSVTHPKPLRDYPAAAFEQGLTGARVTGVGRRAKILVIDLDSGDRLLVHLKMSGRLIYCGAESPRAKHTHVIFGLDNGHELRFVDQRRFGYLKLVEGGDLTGVPETANLGPEPLAADFTEERLADILRRQPNKKIKALLLDQTVLAGIGNLYADEILHGAKIHPDRPAATLSPGETGALYRNLREILSRAIEHRGTSFDLYVDGRGRPGAYLKQLKVYGRSDQGCFECGTTLRKIKVAGRGTQFCPRCQS
jgi:formamidopyrimidine-DNA glycosylase